MQGVPSRHALCPTPSVLNYSQIHNSEGAFLSELKKIKKIDKTREGVRKIGIQITC